MTATSDEQDPLTHQNRHPSLIIATCDWCLLTRSYLAPDDLRTTESDHAHLELMGWSFPGGFAAYCPACTDRASAR